MQKDVKENLEDLFPDKIWVKAEIASVSVKSGGHCYLDLVQSEKGKMVAKANAVIWSSYYHLLNAKFKSVADKDISAGIEVLLRVMVNFHEVYGLSLIIDDIDASFILGEQQLKRAQTIAKLTQEGLMERQKALELRDLPYYLALVSAETAAGLGDFRNHLIAKRIFLRLSVGFISRHYARGKGAGIHNRGFGGNRKFRNPLRCRADTSRRRLGN
ncbi:MAG: exodeoxyribonuclease VII large subunit [Candidatus Cryptobacteroides sp.]